jgi:ParB family chromosome partitioning protein
MSDTMSKTKSKGLGRGLDALLGANRGRTAPADAPVSSATMPIANAGPQDGQMLEIPLEYLQRGKYQPRRDMQDESLQELAESIKAQGVMQPIVIRPIGSNRYEIIAGERRWRACQLAGLEKIPAIVRDVPDEAAVAMALIENIQREDLNAVEEAVALKRLQDEFSLTHQEVADAVGKSRTAVSNILRLLNLCSDVRTMLERGDLEMGHARCLLSMGEDQQRLLARQIVAKGLSVRQAEALVRHAAEGKTKTESKPSADITQLQERLSEQIGVPVLVQHSAKGAGKLILKYSSLDELDGILSHLKYQS